MRPTPNLPNSTILQPILSKMNKSNINTAALYSYGNYLVNLLKTNETIVNKMNISTETDNKGASTDKKQSDGTTAINLQSKWFKIATLENITYIYSDTVKNITSLSQIYTKYKSSSETTKQELNLKKIQPNLHISAEITQPKKIIQETFTLRKITEEKLNKLCDSIEKASQSSNLVKYALIHELFQNLYDRYDNNDIRHIIGKKQKSLIKSLLILQSVATVKDKQLIGNINECLALLGYVDQTSIKQNGINILSLDGGGAKGLVTIEILKQIQKNSGGKPIHELFDYICGVSTGAILATLLGVLKLSLEECEQYYKAFSREIFDRNMAAGLSNLIKTYSYYDTQHWESTLRLAVGDTLLINSAKDKNACKIGIVSNVTTQNTMKVFLFRNYNLPTFSHSHYDGTCKYKVWEAVRASSAAPGYYEDFKLDGYIFHDGGILANNPTSIALHEAKLLWPKSDINCVVSVGNGRYKLSGNDSSKAISVNLKQKLNRFISGISSTESVHTMLCDLMPAKVYYRLNPYMNEEFSLDETRQEKWELMKANTKLYIRRNDFKFKMLANQLLKPKSTAKKVEDYLHKNFNCRLWSI